MTRLRVRARTHARLLSTAPADVRSHTLRCALRCANGLGRHRWYRQRDLRGRGSRIRCRHQAHDATALQSVWRHHARPLRRHKPRLLALVCCVGDVVCQSGDLGWISAHLASLGRAWELSAGRKDSRVGVTVSRAPAIPEA